MDLAGRREEARPEQVAGHAHLEDQVLGMQVLRHLAVHHKPHGGWHLQMQQAGQGASISMLSI